MAASATSYRRQSRKDTKEVINRPRLELNEYVLNEKLKDRLKQLHPNAPEDRKKIFKQYLDEFESAKPSTGRQSSIAQLPKAMTTHRLDFQYQFQPPADIQKPKHSQMLPSSNAEVEKVLGKTNYAVDHEQVAKVTPRKLQPLNTSSTKNNPHPLKPFMDWQIQTHSSEDDPSPLVDHNLYEMVQRDKNQSTYRKDFTPSVPSLLSLSNTSRINSSRRPQYDQDTWKSMNNVTFQYSKQEKALLNPVTRFGSNPHIRNYAIGILPITSKDSPVLGMTAKTCYENYYGARRR